MSKAGPSSWPPSATSPSPSNLRQRHPPRRRNRSRKTGGHLPRRQTAYAQRALAGLEQVKKYPFVDPDKIAAIGYCFGGGVVLEMARSAQTSKASSVFTAISIRPTPLTRTISRPKSSFATALTTLMFRRNRLPPSGPDA